MYDEDILRVKPGGYRGRFDSRHLLVVFSHVWAAQRFERALQYAQKHRPSWKDTGYKRTNVHTKENRFSIFDTFNLPHDFPLGNSFTPLTQHERKDKELKETNITYWKICTFNIQSVRDQKRLKRLVQFLLDNRIDVLAVQETNWKGEDFSHLLREYTWFGSKPTTKQSGVGFLIRTSLLEGVKVEFKIGKTSENAIFLVLSKPNSRSTCFMNVYGKSNADSATARDQWNAHTVDLQATLTKAPRDTDVVFLGDINARCGSAKNCTEERVIGRYGEPNTKRNLGGELAIQFFEGCNLRCLNARTPTEHPPFTFHSRQNGHSIIDIIAVSDAMSRNEYNARLIYAGCYTDRQRRSPSCSVLSENATKASKDRTPSTKNSLE